MLDKGDIERVLQYVNAATAQSIWSELWQMERDGKPDVNRRQLEYLTRRLTPLGAPVYYLQLPAERAPAPLPPAATAPSERESPLLTARELARRFGQLGGRQRSERKAAACRLNGRQGGAGKHQSRRANTR